MNYIAEIEMEGERIDKCIPLFCENLSRNYAARLIKDGLVTVNGKPVKASYVLSEGDEVSFDVPAASIPDIEPENIPLDIIYEDKQILVINKPTNCLTIGTDKDKIHCLYHDVREYLNKKNQTTRLRVTLHMMFLK